jgi:Tol biopolymer transport system component
MIRFVVSGVLALLPIIACSKKQSNERTATYIETSSRPAWTPDGKKLVVAAWIEDNYELVLIGEDGTGESRLTRNKVYDGSPSVSPDGKSVLYESMLEGDRGIYVIALDGTNPTRIAGTSSNETLERSPVWLADGGIVFLALGANKPDLMRVGSDIKATIRVAKAPFHRESPAISRDGKRIAFCSKATWPTTISVMDLDGGNETTVISASGNVDWPTWSRDSSRLAYVLDENGGSNVYVKDVPSGSSRRISPAPKSDDWYWCPEWSPNGEWIAFNEHVAQNWGIAIVKPDGTGYLRIRQSQKWEGHPVWSPDSTRIAFHARGHIFVVDIGTQAMHKVR